MKSIISLIGIVTMTCLLVCLSGCDKPMATQEMARAESSPGQPASDVDTSAGKTIYDDRCANCHRLGGYDADGNADDLVGQGSRLTKKFLARHNGDGLSTADIANLRAFIARR